MKRNLLLILMIAIGINSCSSIKSKHENPFRLSFKNGDNQIVPTEIKFLRTIDDAEIVFYTAGKLIRAKDGSIFKETQIPLVKTLCSFNGKLFAGTTSGLYVINDTGATLMPIPAKYETPEVNALATINDDTLWIGTGGYGLFAFTGDKIMPKAGVPYISSIIFTYDSSLWYGTHTGLARQSKEFSEIYSEEIQHRGLAIPDNIIENLCTDKFDNLWVIMSKQVMILTPSMINDKESDHMHPNTIPYIGSRENTVTKIAHFEKDMDYWVLATEEGLVVLKNIEITDNHDEHGEGIPDVIENPRGDAKLFTFSEKTSGILPEDRKIDDIDFDKDGNLLVANKRGLWVVPRKILDQWAYGK